MSRMGFNQKTVVNYRGARNGFKGGLEGRNPRIVYNNNDLVFAEYAIQMEHSYSRDQRPIEGANGLSTRTLMVHRPPQCPSCHSHPMDEGIDLDEANHPPIPSYNETAAKEAMDECTRVANSVRNLNADDEIWEEKVNRTGWTAVQERLFVRIARVLDMDHLARLATNGRQHEPVQRRVIIDRSVNRIRQALASVSWEPKLTQWIHGILMDHLPATYMASYLDILQTLKTKLPTLMDKMLFGRPMNINQELLAPVMKKQWDPIVSQKNRKIPTNCVILIVPSSAPIAPLPSRIQKWHQLFSTIAPIVQVNLKTSATLHTLSLDQVAEHIVAMSRAKIQELRNEQPGRHIILVGFNAGAALALQVGLAETVNSIVCMGFAYNTMNGVRGAPDDRILDITTPIMFVIGQNSARSSQEELESLREKMQSQSSLVVVGSADDALRVPKNKRRIDNVTQSMVDNMVTDEIYEFIRNCVTNPPGPRQPTNLNYVSPMEATPTRVVMGVAGPSGVRGQTVRKRRQSQGSDTETPAKAGKFITNRPQIIGRPRTRPLITTTSTPKPKLLSQPSTEALNMAIQSILPEDDKNTSSHLDDLTTDDGQMIQYEIISHPKLQIRQTTGGSGLTNIRTTSTVPMIQRTTGGTVGGLQKLKMIPSNQFVQLKPPQGGATHKIYTVKGPGTNVAGASGDATQGQIITVKSAPAGQQYIQSAATSPLVISPSKFTILKGPSTPALISSGGDAGDIAKSSTDLSNTNIFDIPIIFADNDGNIQDTTPIAASSSVVSNTTTPPTASQIIITSQPQQITTLEQSPAVAQAKSIILNTSGVLSKSKPGNKVVFLNRSTMKPFQTVLSKNVPPLKYAKVLVTNPNSSTPSLVTRPIGTITTGGDITKEKSGITTLTLPGKSGVANILKTTPQQMTTLTQPQAQQTVIGTLQNKQFQPIIINVDSDKTTIKNMIKVGGDTTNTMKPTILLKHGGLKSIPMLKPGILNRNLTVRKVVNIVQGKPTITTTISPNQSMPITSVATNTSEVAKAIIVSSSGDILPVPSSVAVSSAAQSTVSSVEQSVESTGDSSQAQSP